MPDLSVKLGGLAMRNPIMIASGTAGYGHEYEGVIDFGAVGAVVMKTITLKPRTGNRPPRLHETGGGLLNAIGLENVGLEAFLSDKLPRAAGLGAPLVASIAGTSPAEYAELAREVGAREEVAAVELNISCPNVERPRRPLWSDPAGVRKTVSAARAETAKTILLKLSPSTADPLSVAEAAEEGGADALVVANTLPAMRIDVARRRPALGNVTGGLSGSALMPVNLALVWRVYEVVSVPIVGSGGIATASDALEYLMAGAAAFQIGTALFADPGAPRMIADDLATRMEEDGARTPGDYTGLAREETASCRQTVAAD